MTDYVSVRDLTVPAVIGVHDWERQVEQTLIISVEMAADVRKAAADDDLGDALDYSAVAQTITAVLREGRFRLIETAAERVAGRLLADFPLPWLRLELRKHIANGGYTAAVTIERTREVSLRRGVPARGLPTRCPVSLTGHVTPTRYARIQPGAAGKQQRCHIAAAQAAAVSHRCCYIRAGDSESCGHSDLWCMQWVWELRRLSDCDSQVIAIMP